MKIIYVPIEPLKERYTESWYRNIPIFFRGQGCEVETVEGSPLTDAVTVGTFLDINSTVAYKAEQLKRIAQMFHERRVADGSVFFFGDVEFWGIEAVRLMAQINQVDVKLTGFLHAASYTAEDAFAVAADYQRYTELGWLKALDRVFVGSHYHRDAVIERRVNEYGTREDQTEIPYKIQVTGNPMFRDDYEIFPGSKKKQLVIANRFDWEKRPNLSLDFAYLLKRQNPDLEVVVVTSRPRFRSNREWLVSYARQLEKDGVLTIREGLTKTQYHQVLDESMVMLTNTIEENFGYCIVEACHYGCYPILKNAYSHPELVQWDTELLFDTEDEIIPKVERILKGDCCSDVHRYAEHYFYSMEQILRQLQTV